MTAVVDRAASTLQLAAYARLRTYVSVETNACAFFERGFLTRRGWRAVAVSEELSASEAAGLSAACKAFGYAKATALTIDHFDPDAVHEISLDAHSLASLEKIFVAPSYLLIEEKERFMLVSDGDYYWSLAGPPVFLERCLGETVDSANRKFVEATRRYRDGSSPIGRVMGRIASETAIPPL